MSAIYSKSVARTGAACGAKAGPKAVASMRSASAARVPFSSVASASSVRGAALSRAQQVRVVCAAVAEAARPAAIAKTPVTNQKPTVIITGASSGLGLNAAKALAQAGEWHVVMAVRDFGKAEQAAKRLGFPAGSYSVMHLDLSSLESVRQFAANFKASGRRLDALVCNAAVYLPTAKEPTFTADGYEVSVQTNHLGHFLLVQLLLEDLKSAPNKAPRCVIVGSITGNTNTLAGNVPPKANLGDMSGLEKKLPMIDAGEFNGAKAYKDSKVCNMLTMRELHKRLNSTTGVTFASLYPGCIAETGLFRSHVPLFRALFPPFQKFVTKGYVSEEEAGRRLAQVVSDPKMSKSGVYWSWNNSTGSFENQVSEEVSDDAKAAKLYDLSLKLVGLA